MEDMSIELDIEDDLIKRFLLHKLDEIKLSNGDLEQQISRRKELLNECVEKMASKFSPNILEVTGTWQRILNGKWIIGIGVNNTRSCGFAKNINVILNWDLSTPLIYNIKTFCRYKHAEQQESTLPENLKKIAKTLEKSDSNRKLYPLDDEWIRTDEVRDDLSIIMAFEIPQFFDKLEYNISGILSYQFKEKSCQLNIPNFKIAASDVTDNMRSVKSFDVVSGGEEAYLSTLIANEESELVVRVSKDTYTSLENILEIELLFRKANIVSRTKQFFYTDNIIGSNGECLLLLEKEDDTLYNFNIFSRDQTSLHLMLHCLHKHIPDIIILPKKYKENLLQIPLPVVELFTQQTDKNTIKLKSTLNELGKSLESQISLVETFCTEHLDKVPEEIVEDKDEVDLNVEIQDYQCLRKQLTDLELNADLLFTKIEKFTTKSESNSEVDME